MKTGIFLRVAVAFSALASAAGATGWQAVYDGGYGADSAKAVVVDRFGYVYVLGSSQGATDMDVVLLRYDGGTGEELFAVRWGSDPGGDDRPVALAVDDAGATAGDAMAYVAVATHGDYCALSYDAGGNLRWQRTYDNGAADEPTDIAVRPAGGRRGRCQQVL